MNQPIKAAWIEDELYLEAHATLSQSDRVEEIGGYPPYEVTDADMKLIRDIAGEHEDKLNWLQIRKIIRERSGTPLLIATRPAPTPVVTEEKADEHAQTDMSKDANTPENTDTPEEKLSDSEHAVPTDETPIEDEKEAEDTKKPVRKRPVFKHNS